MLDMMNSNLTDSEFTDLGEYLQVCVLTIFLIDRCHAYPVHLSTVVNLFLVQIIWQMHQWQEHGLKMFKQPASSPELTCHRSPI